MRILVIEDEDTKYSDLCKAIGPGDPPYEFVRAPNINLGEEYLSGGSFNIVVLDISLNISRGSLGAAKGGHANLGGLQIVERMWLLGIEVPTVIVTGFDVFERPSAKSKHLEILNLYEVEKRAREFLKSCYRGCIRYGSPGWQSTLKSCIENEGSMA
jgi:hypothetical protein